MCPPSPDEHGTEWAGVWILASQLKPEAETHMVTPDHGHLGNWHKLMVHCGDSCPLSQACSWHLVSYQPTTTRISISPSQGSKRDTPGLEWEDGMSLLHPAHTWASSRCSWALGQAAAQGSRKLPGAKPNHHAMYMNF